MKYSDRKTRHHMKCIQLIRNSSGLKFIQEGIEIKNNGIKSASGTILHIDPRDFTLYGYLGKGASGYVQKGRHNPTNLDVAIKVVNIYEKGLRHQLKCDLKVLIRSMHPNLVRNYLGAILWGFL